MFMHFFYPQFTISFKRSSASPNNVIAVLSIVAKHSYLLTVDTQTLVPDVAKKVLEGRVQTPWPVRNVNHDFSVRDLSATRN